VRHEGLDRGEVNNGLSLYALAHFLAEYATKERSASRVDSHDFPSALHLGNFNLIGNDEATTNQVDEVTRQEVFGQKKLPGATLETSQINFAALKGHAAFGQAADLANWHEEIAALNTNDGTHDWRVSVVTEARDQVLDATNPVTVLIKDRTAQESGKVKYFSHSKP
jgi:hypothetical protein